VAFLKSSNKFRCAQSAGRVAVDKAALD